MPLVASGTRAQQLSIGAGPRRRILRCKGILRQPMDIRLDSSHLLAAFEVHWEIAGLERRLCKGGRALKPQRIRRHHQTMQHFFGCLLVPQHVAHDARVVGRDDGRKTGAYSELPVTMAARHDHFGDRGGSSRDIRGCRGSPAASFKDLSRSSMSPTGDLIDPCSANQTAGEWSACKSPRTTARCIESTLSNIPGR